MQSQWYPTCRIFFKGKRNLNRQYTLLADEEWWHSMKVMYLFFKKGNIFPSFSLTFFLTMVCIFALNEDCTAFLCSVFTLCVKLRIYSNVSYFCNCGKSEHIQYSCTVYIQYIIQKQCDRRDSLCCTWLSLDCFCFVCFLFWFYFVLSLDSKTVCFV